MPKVKKTGAIKVNQLLKSRGRVNRVTVLKSLVKRLQAWRVLEVNTELRDTLSMIADLAAGMEQGREQLTAQLDTLIATNYTPPKKPTSGTLKFEYGRQVWFKGKHKELYASVYPQEILDNLYVDKIVKGRVALSVGHPDSGTYAPRIMAPKIHITGTAPA